MYNQAAAQELGVQRSTFCMGKSSRFRHRPGLCSLAHARWLIIAAACGAAAVPATLVHGCSAYLPPTPWLSTITSGGSGHCIRSGQAGWGAGAASARGELVAIGCSWVGWGPDPPQMHCLPFTPLCVHHMIGAM